MRTAVLWGLLALLCQHTLVSTHTLGRPSPNIDLVQLKSLLQRFEEMLTESAQEDSEADYDDTNQQPDNSQVPRGWNLDQEGPVQPLTSERSQLPAEGPSRGQSDRSRLLDLLMGTRKRSSGCFGARMDRIGNASGLGCNTGRG
ncbi:hypothetical protein PBY51_000016 [Eleginops maclovinus]|uniref:Uncharacterized protein n=1 Tax=Eleginops maclovinus TaxID=56733 RepID=A0AAN7XEP7_ELEMC|nr:hypothetical protein PBY51_000016 [Eleginops maclovinus]